MADKTTGIRGLMPCPANPAGGWHVDIGQAAVDVADLIEKTRAEARRDLLTGAERRAMELTVELVNLMCREVIGDGPSRSGDVNEFVDAVHRIQQMILSQAAARAYPDRYRLLGETVKEAAGGK